MKYGSNSSSHQRQAPQNDCHEVFFRSESLLGDENSRFERDGCPWKERCRCHHWSGHDEVGS